MELSSQPSELNQGFVPTHALTPNYRYADALLRAKDYEGALEVLNREEPTSLCYGMAMAQAGKIHRDHRRWESAIADSEKAVTAFAQFCSVPQMYIMARRNIGDAYAALEPPLRSLEHYHAAADLAVELSEKSPEFAPQLLRERIVTLINLGSTYLRVDQPEAAITALQEARTLLQGRSDAIVLGLPQTLELLAMAYEQSATKNPEYALGVADTLSGLSPDQKQRLQLAQIQLLHRPQSDAEPVIRQAIAEALAENNPVLATMRCGIGLIAAVANKEIDWGKELIAIADGLELQLPANSLWPARLSRYRAQLFQLEGASPADIRRTLVIGAHQFFTRSRGTEQLADFQLLAGQSNIHFRLLARHCLDAGQPQEAFVAFEAGRARAVIAEMRNNLSHELTAECPFHRDGSIHLTLLKNIQSRLAEGEVSITLASLHPDTVCFVVGANTFEFFQVETLETIGPELRQVAKRLANNEGLSAIPLTAQEIAQKVIAIVGDRTVRALVPFGSLHLIPWRALLNDLGLPWAKLGFGVSFSPTFHVRHPIDRMQCEAIGYGGDKGLDFGLEAKEFAELFGSAGHFVPDATKEDFRNALKEPSIVMVSCHGLLLDGMLGQNFHFALKDGNVRLDEVLPTQPRSPLIILSACDSGAYFMMKGDYPVGAAPKIVLGGNAYCACTRFPIRADFSRRYFSAFGKRLIAGRLPEAALAEASAELAANGADLWRDLACVELLIRGD